MSESPISVQRAVRDVANDLAGWRKLRGLTQAQLAERAGLSRDTVTRFEKGDGGIALDSLMRLVRALGLLSVVHQALDPYNSDVGRLRSDEQLPQRVRPRSLRDND